MSNKIDSKSGIRNDSLLYNNKELNVEILEYIKQIF